MSDTASADSIDKPGPLSSGARLWRHAQLWIASEGQRWLFVVKTLLAAFLALWLAFRFGLDSPRSAMMTVFIVALPSSGMALEKSIYRLGGTLVGCAVALVLIGLFPQQAILLFISLSIWIGVCTAGSALMRNARSYGFVLAGYTACMIAIPAVAAPAEVFNLAVARVTEISLGILCAAFINDMLFPRHQSDQLVTVVRRLYGNFAQLCHDAMQGQLSDDQLEKLHLQFAVEVAALESGRAAAFFEAGDMRTRNQQLHAFNAAAMVSLTTFHTLHQLMQRMRTRGNTLVPQLMMPLYAAFSDALLVSTQPAKTAAEAGITLEKLMLLQQHLPQMMSDARRRLQMSIQASQADPSQQLDLDTALELTQRFNDEFSHLVTVYHNLPKRLSERQVNSLIPILAYSTHTPIRIVLASGLRSTATLLILVFAWYGLNWPGAAGAVILAVIFSGLAASSANPRSMIRQITIGFGSAIPFAYFCAFLMLNHVEGYLMLVLSMLPFLVAGTYVSTIREVAGIGMGFNLMFAQIIAPENLMRFNIVMFLNESIAQVIGLAVAGLMFALIFPRHLQGARPHIADSLWEEALRVCVSDKPHLRHNFESRIRDLLNQLNMGIRGTADQATRHTLNQAITLLELGHAIIDLREINKAWIDGHPIHRSQQACINALADWFRKREPRQKEKLMILLAQTSALLQQFPFDQADFTAHKKTLVQRASSNLHLIASSLQDPALDEFVAVPKMTEGLLHAT